MDRITLGILIFVSCSAIGMGLVPYSILPNTTVIDRYGDACINIDKQNVPCATEGALQLHGPICLLKQDDSDKIQTSECSQSIGSRIFTITNSSVILLVSALGIMSGGLLAGILMMSATDYAVHKQKQKENEV
jgi:hypothetical protein